MEFHKPWIHGWRHLVARLINGLVKRKWVSRHQYEDDKRIIKVGLTEKGKVAQAVFEQQFDKIGQIIEKNIDPIDQLKAINIKRKLKLLLLILCTKCKYFAPHKVRIKAKLE